MAVSLVRKLARRCRPRVYPLVGSGGRERAWRLRIDDRLVLTWSPRDATMLVVVGDVPAPLAAQAALLHDQLPRPRGVVVWSDDRETRAVFPVASDVRSHDSPIPVIERAFRGLMDGTLSSSPALLPRDNPVHWKGVGPFGQGGEGMMGGRPYGRRMAMTGDEGRDGLALDRTHVTIGPFMPWMPPGLELEIELQGDVIQRLTPRTPEAGLLRDRPEPFARADREQVFVADLEVARARHHLGVTAELFSLHGLDALARRLLRLSRRVRRGESGTVRELARTLERSGALRLATRDVGELRSELIAGTGPAARAAGLPGDARDHDPAYADLRGQAGATPREPRGDAESRFRQRLAEAAESLEIAARAGARRRRPGPPLEGVRGPEGGGAVPPRWSELLQEAAPGRAWDAFVTTLVSLDVDPADFPASDAYGRSRVGAFAEGDDGGGLDRGGADD